MALTKSVDLAYAQRAVPCNICEDDVPGEYYCIECKQTLCPQCEKNHKRVAATKNHNIILRTQVGDIDTTILTCADHGDMASFHCEKCNTPACTNCVTGKHKGHDMSNLDDILEKEKHILENDIKAMQRALPTLMKQSEGILTEKEKYIKEIKKNLKDMEDENQAVMKKLEKIHRDRVEEIMIIQDSHMEMFEVAEREMKRKITSYENRISEYKDAVGKNSLSVLRNISKGKLSLPEIGSKLEFPDPPKFVDGYLQSIVENLNKLIISPSSLMSKQLKVTTPTVVSKFKCPLDGYPRICITKEGNVWLGGHKSRKLVMMDINGHVIRRMKLKNRTAALAVMDSGDFILSPHGDDSNSVSKLMKDGREQRVFDTSPSFSFGVSVTADQKLLICTVDGRVVRINGDGTNGKEIYKGSDVLSTVHAVENANGNIYISNRTNHAVVIVSRDGIVQSTITHTRDGRKLQKPKGLVMDKMHNMLCADTDADCVYIMDQNQEMRELVGRSHGIESPQWVAVDNNENLWIAQENGNIHVVKYLSA